MRSLGRSVDGAELVDELGGPDVVVGDPVDDRIALGVLVRLHPRRDAVVRPRAVALGERAVGDLPHEVGAEGPLLALARAAEHEELLGLERLEHRPHVVDAEVLPRHHLDGHHRTAAAEHRTVVEHAPLVGGEAVEPRGDEAAEGVGQLDVVLVVGMARVRRPCPRRTGG